MDEAADHEVDRSGWPAGPWDGEPDRIEWADEATGLPCLMQRNRMGAWCGYAAVNPGHPFHGLPYEEAEISVHGGLTYSGECQGHICHVPQPGEPDDVWWFGFDCAHSFDDYPMLHMYGGGPFLRDTVYRDVTFVRREVTRLASDLAAIGTDNKEDKP